jgi:outer membrane protein assembly factor BamB
MKAKGLLLRRTLPAGQELIALAAVLMMWSSLACLSAGPDVTGPPQSEPRLDTGKSPSLSVEAENRLPPQEELALAQSRPARSPGPQARPAGDLPYWPRFHGPNFDNISPDTGLLKKWPADGPSLRWKVRGIGEGYSSVTLAGGRIFTAGNIKNRTIVTALDLNGRILWQADNGPAWTGSYPGTRGTPTIDGPRVYHESPLGQLTCFDARSGKPLWSVNILERFRSQNITWALAESVLIDGERVICCPGGPVTSVVALNKMTGDIVWTSPSTGDLASYASPSLGEFAGRRIIFTMNARAVIGVDADRGDLLFRHEHVTSWDVNALMPIYHNGQVFVSTGYGTGAKMLRLSAKGDKIDTSVVWEERRFDNHHGGVLLLNGYLYGSNHRGRWMCLDWATGKISYDEAGVGKGSLTFADGMLYVLSERGVVGLVEAGPQAHRVVSSFRLPPDGTGPSWAHPVVIGGVLYIRHGDVLYAYDVRAR